MSALLRIDLEARLHEAPQYRLRRLIQNRSRRRELVAHYIANRDELLGFLSRYPAPVEFASVDEAIVWFRKEMARQYGLGAHGHWAFSNSILAACKDRLIIARYFSWVEKAEAADLLRRAA